MSSPFIHRIIAPASLLLLLVVGCSRDKPNPVRPIVGPKPDFSLLDMNPNSASLGQAVSPRQEMGKISAWYFGHAT